MKDKRAFHKETILKHQKKVEEREIQNTKSKVERSNLPSSSTDDINDAFSEVITPKKRKMDDLYRNEKKKKQKVLKDDEFYIPYSAPDKHTEDGSVT